MEQRVIIESEIDTPPEEKINKRIAQLGDGWEVVSANTSSQNFKQELVEGSMQSRFGCYPRNQHLYTTTVLVKQTN